MGDNFQKSEELFGYVKKKQYICPIFRAFSKIVRANGLKSVGK